MFRFFTARFFILWIISVSIGWGCTSFHIPSNQEPSAFQFKEISQNQTAENKKLYIKESKNFIADISVVERPEVDVWIRYFTGRGRDRMKLYLERSHRYKDIMQAVLRKNGLPESLVYIAMIESGFNPKARSRANAMGYWQFIAPTGRRYGLKMNHFIDERRDPVLSTEAAVKYLKDLHNLFGSWYLAMASYNAGEYRVNRAMMRHYTRDFWKLRAKKSLPRETREYVPKFIAAQLISQNPSKYGFTELKYQEPIAFEFLKIHQPISLKKLAHQLSLKYKDLKMLNPKYVSEYVPMGKGGVTTLRIPVGFSKKVTKEVIVASVVKHPPKRSKNYIYYKVRWGDTLYRLAIRHRTTVNTIARMNRMSPKRGLQAGQVIKLPPLYGRYNVAQKKNRSHATFHKVKKGESLNRVAKKYGISVGQLKKWNRIPSSIIHPNQVLRVKSPGSSVKTHTIRKGDTLISIAKQYKVPLVTLMKKNSLTFKSIIRAGRTIVIPE